MQILTAAEMAEADKRSVEMGVPVARLMENAGEAVARFCLSHYPGAGAGPAPIVVLCGKGNNGGDGMVAARRLAEAGRRVRVALLGNAVDVKGDALTVLLRAEAANTAKPIEVLEITAESDLQKLFEFAALVIDAVVGTGFKPPLRGLAATARDLLAKMKVPIVAVDLPSGWDADATTQHASGAVKDETDTAFRASAVVTFALPKLAHVFGHLTAGNVFGPVVVAPIGTPDDAIDSRTQLRWAGGAKVLGEKPRNIDGNKGRFGHVLILGGSLGKAGAPSMASLAAMRAGAGLTTAAVPHDVLATVAAVAPELMLTPLESAHSGGLALDQIDGDKLDQLTKGISVVGIGPGLGQEGSTPEFVRSMVDRVSLPMVIDADALNAFAGHAELLKKAASGKDGKGKPRTIVLTPHPGEMARLVGSTVKDVEADRIGLARRFATEHRVTLVLKGWRTLIAHPDGMVAVNTTGNPAMAKGGSGDILTGIVAAMLGQYPDDVARAVEAAVFLHGLAGDFAALDQDEHTVLATDTVMHLATAFRSRVMDADGFTWICGGAAQSKGKA
ncbi:MAG TPA: NAD(P)H-hydrate dehydratase [Acidobacteriaceae bacterium]